jgi:hypothetical protein
VRAPPSRRGGVPRLALLLLLLAACVATLFFLLSRPRLRFANRLAAPVRVSVGGHTRTVGPGITETFVIPRGRTQVVEWAMVRPLSADSTPMGEEMRGAVVLRSPGGALSAAAETRQNEAEYFAPLITNASSRPLRVTVNAGLTGAVDCGCAVRPGGRRVFVGYYRLYKNSTVQARDGELEATFRDLGSQVVSRNGTVGLRFEDKDLRPPVNRRAGGTGARSRA